MVARTKVFFLGSLKLSEIYITASNIILILRVSVQGRLEFKTLVIDVLTSLLDLIDF